MTSKFEKVAEAIIGVVIVAVVLAALWWIGKFLYYFMEVM
jgi:hypothetical protein